MKPNLVFLDFDGVLNSSRWWQESATVPHVDKDIDPRAVVLLNELAPAKTTRIVVTSVFRARGKAFVREMLEHVGVVARVVDVTPTLRGDYTRGREIQTWLSARRDDFAEYVILDDDFDAGLGHTGHFVKTNVREGLTAADVVRAKAILGVP